MPRQTTLDVVDPQIQLTPLTPRRPGLSRRPLMALPMCAVFGAFGAIIWLSHPGGALIGEPPLIQAALTPIKMAPKVDELLSAPDRASTAGAVFVAVAGAAIDPGGCERSNPCGAARRQWHACHLERAADPGGGFAVERTR